MKNEEQFPREMLQAAGQRPPIPAEDMTAIKEAARSAWHAKYVDRHFGVRRQFWLLPVAAALLGGLVLTWWRMQPPAPSPRPVSAAEVDALKGAVQAIRPGATQAAPIAAGQALPAGALIDTDSESHAALRLPEGQSLRLDAATRVRLISGELVALERGTVYLDSQNRRAVTIRTPFADFRPAGTQFEVRLPDGDSARLRVREGRVRLSGPSATLTLIEGEEVLVRRNGSMVRGHVRPDDPSWDWILEAVAMPPIEGQTLRSFLDWFAREKGLKLRFASDEAASLSKTIVLHGSVAELTPVDALRTVTLSSGFEARIENGALEVKTKN